MEQTVRAGERVQLPCEAEPSTDNYMLEWLKDDQVIYTKFSTRQTGDAVGAFAGRVEVGGSHSLSLGPVQQLDAGVYWCRLKLFAHAKRHPAGKRIQLVVHTVPVLVETSESTLFTSEGATVSLTCKASATPAATISWQKDNVDIEPSSSRAQAEKYSVTQQGQVLTIRRLRREDATSYSCVAANHLGADRHTTVVKFAEPVTFVQDLTNTEALEGVNFAWQCQAHADPPSVKYRWLREGKEVRLAGELGLRAQVMGGDLMIEPVMRSDAGWYTCEATNGHGETATSRAYLNIHYPAEISQATEPIQYIPRGLLGRVTCIVDANPRQHSVVWSKDGNHILTDGPDGLYSEEDTGATLVISKVIDTDGGVYKCQAYNHGVGGNNGNGEFEIHVIVAEPPEITEHPAETVRTTVGATIVLNCGGQGEPTPDVFWRKLHPNQDSRLGEPARDGVSSLRLPAVTASDYGTYECVVKDKVVERTASTTLLVDDSPPQAPEDVVVKTTPFDAVVSWTPGYNGGSAQTFTVKYRRHESRGVWHEAEVADATSYTISRLQPDTLYDVGIVPNNAFGIGFQSQATTVATKGYDAVPAALPTDASGVTYYPEISEPIGPGPNAPGNLRVDSVGQQLRLTWDAPLNDDKHTDTVYYAVEYKQDTASSSATGSATPEVADDVKPAPGDDQFLILARPVLKRELSMTPGQPGQLLHPGREYQLRVRAHSVISYSQPSPVVSYRVPGVSPHMALMAAIMGGLLFLMLFLILGCCLVRRAKRNSQKQRLRNKQQTLNYNGNGTASNGTWLTDAEQPRYSSGPDLIHTAYDKQQQPADVSYGATERGLSGHGGHGERVCAAVGQDTRKPGVMQRWWSRNVVPSFSEQAGFDTSSTSAVTTATDSGSAVAAVANNSEMLNNSQARRTITRAVAQAELQMLYGHKQHDLQLDDPITDVNQLLHNLNTTQDSPAKEHQQLQLEASRNGSFRFKVQHSPEVYNRERLMRTIEELRRSRTQLQQPALSIQVSAHESSNSSGSSSGVSSSTPQQHWPNTPTQTNQVTCVPSVVVQATAGVSPNTTDDSGNASHQQLPFSPDQERRFAQLKQEFVARCRESEML